MNFEGLNQLPIFPSLSNTERDHTFHLPMVSIHRPQLQPPIAPAGRARTQAQPLVTQSTASATGFTTQAAGNTTSTGARQEMVSAVCFL